LPGEASTQHSWLSSDWFARRGFYTAFLAELRLICLERLLHSIIGWAPSRMLCRSLSGHK